jgi:hypothetical protein
MKTCTGDGTSGYSKGTFTVGGSTVTVTNTCEYGSWTTSFDYSVTSATTVDITLPGPGYTTVTTYTRN